jgi:DNA-binding response OmpR family regulator
LRAHPIKTGKPGGEMPKCVPLKPGLLLHPPVAFFGAQCFSAMNSMKKILLVHGDQTTSRTLTLLLTGVGYHVRSYAEPDAAIEAVRVEGFDLTLVADSVQRTGGPGFVEALKALRPDMAVLLLVDQLGLAPVLESIRLSVTDVLAPGDDWTLVLRRVNAILRPGEMDFSPAITPVVRVGLEAVQSGGRGASPKAGSEENRWEAEFRLREKEMELRLGQIRLEREKREVQEEMELLREQEANLRTYEERLRAMGEVAADGQVPKIFVPVSREPPQREGSLAEEWARVDREADTLQAERRNFNDEKLVLKEEFVRLRALEEELRQREENLAARAVQPAVPQVEAAPPVRSSFSQSPFKAVRAIFTNSRQ